MTNQFQDINKTLKDYGTFINNNKAGAIAKLNVQQVKGVKSEEFKNVLASNVDAETVIDSFVKFATTDVDAVKVGRLDKATVDGLYNGGLKEAGWKTSSLLIKDKTSGKELAESVIVALNLGDITDSDPDNDFNPFIPTPTPIPSPSPVTPLSLDSTADFTKDKADWMKALIPETGKEGTAFEFKGETYKYAVKTDQLQKKDSASSPSTFKDVDVPIELKQAKGQLIMAVDLTKDLINKNLSSAFLSSEKLENANFTGANLTGAKLTGANLTNANLKNADLTSVVLAETLSSVLTVANLTGADLTGANLMEAKLQIGSPAEWYKITDTQIQIYDSTATSKWKDSPDPTTNLTVINEFEKIVTNAQAGTPDQALINGKNLTTVIDELKAKNQPTPAPTVTSPTTVTPPTTVTSPATPPREPIMGIDRAKFGDLLTDGETYLKWEHGIALQTALNVLIITGKITIGGTMPERLFVDGLFGEKSAMIAQAWLDMKENETKTLKDLLSSTSSPPLPTVPKLSTVGGTMLGIGSGGKEVEDLQTQLKVTVDGIYGTQTEAAVTAFQAGWNTNHANLAEKIYEDGVAGPQTRGALQSVNI